MFGQTWTEDEVRALRLRAGHMRSEEIALALHRPLAATRGKIQRLGLTFRVTFPSSFWRYVKFGAGCWLWVGELSDRGYGRFSHERFNYQAHRLAYALTYGEIPEGHEAHHRCHNPACVRPDHMQILPVREHHALTSREKVRSHCVRGHAFTPENTMLVKGKKKVCRTCSRERCLRYYHARRAAARSIIGR